MSFIQHFILASFLTLPVLRHLPEHNIRQLHYDIFNKNKVVGNMISLRVEKDGAVQYITESNIKMSLLIRLAIYNKVQGIFINGFLQRGSILRKVNGKTKVDTHITWNKDRYLIKDDQSVTEQRSKITYTTACLMYIEPYKITAVFSEGFKQFVPLKQVSAHKYVLQLPDGHENFYTYRDGKCIEVEVVTTFATIFIRERK